MPANDPRVTKRKVTMKNAVLVGRDDQGRDIIQVHELLDYIRPDHLDAYVTDARTKYQVVSVSDEPDAGPGGYEGATAVPAHLPLPDAGVVYPEEK